MDGQDRGDGSWLAGLAADVETSGFADYLLDAAVVDQAAKDLTAYLRDELGVPMPNALVRVGLRLLAGALYDRGKKGAGRVLSGTLAMSAAAFARLPYCDRFCDAFRTWLRGKAGDGKARAQFDALVKGDRSGIDPELLASLSTDMRFQLRQLSEMNELRGALDAGFREVLARLDPQPQLDGKLLAESDHARLHFGAGRIPFIGREAELARLYEFLAMDGAFRWWTLLGEGGMGKSRLALELCLRAGVHWRTGFLPRGQLGFDWSQWRPEAPTLLVIDYAAAVPKEVGGMLEALRLRASNMPLDHPVRVLLLERRREGRWWDTLFSAGDRAALQQSGIEEAVPLELASLGDDGLWAIVLLLGGDGADALGRHGALVRLRQIDKEGRPLFAALAGEALAAGADLRQWNKTDLLADWLRRERERHWHPFNVDEAHINLAVLATMVQGIDDDVLAVQPAEIALPSPENLDPAAYAAVTGRWPVQIRSAEGSEFFLFPPLEPDILGIWFVLEHLRDPLGRGIGTPAVRTARADRYRDAAWSLHARSAAGFLVFLDRAKDDFLENALLRRWAFSAPTSDRAWPRRLWCILTINLILTFEDAGDLQGASARLDALGALAAAHPTDAELRLRYAQGSINLILSLGGAGDLRGATARFNALSELAAAYPTEAELRLELAKGSFNLINGLLKAGDVSGASARLELLEMLAVSHPTEAEVRLNYAKASFNVFNEQLKWGDVSGASARLDMLRRLATRHPAEPELRMELARGSANLIWILGNAGDMSGAAGRLDFLRGLAAAHPAEVELRLQLSKASYNLIDALLRAGNVADASARLEMIGDLVAAHPSDAELRLVYAQGSANLISALGDAGDVAGASARLDALGNLAGAHPRQAELRLRCAQGSLKLISVLGAAGDVAGASARLKVLGDLAAMHPSESELGAKTGLAAYFLLYVLRAAGAQTEAANLMRAFLLFLDHPEARANLAGIFGPDGAQSLVEWVDGLKGGAQ